MKSTWLRVLVEIVSYILVFTCGHAGHNMVRVVVVVVVLLLLLLLLLGTILKFLSFWAQEGAKFIW